MKAAEQSTRRPSADGPGGIAMPRVAVVVLNWNRPEDTIACLRALERIDYPNYVVVAVDNGSTDRSEARIRAACPNATVLQTGSNLGFAGGNNVGIRYALARRVDYIWLLNNDALPEAGALTAMVAEAEADRHVGIVGSLLYHMDEPDRIQAWGGGSMRPWLGLTVRETKPRPGGVDYVAGASMLIRREALDDIGLLDDTYFFYQEDADYSLLARRRGWRLAVARDAAVRHRLGASVNARGEPSARGGLSPVADRLHARASGIFVGRHAGRRVAVAVVVRLAGMTVRRARRRQLARMPRLATEFLRGVGIGRRTRRA